LAHELRNLLNTAIMAFEAVPIAPACLTLPAERFVICEHWMFVSI